MNFVRIGNIERSSGNVNPNKGYESDIKGLNFDLGKISQLVNGKMSYVIIGNRNENQTDKGSGVFLRKSKSGSSLVYYIGNQLYSIPIKAFLNETQQWIGISKIVSS